MLRCVAHPAAVRRLLDRERVLPAGPGVVAARGLDLVVPASDLVQLYVEECAWPALVEALLIQESGSQVNLQVRLPRMVWPFEGDDQVPDSVLAADLLEEAEPRAASAGLGMLNRVAASLVGERG